jgi:diguanylate cyclase (GGDEF)-like protein
MFKPLTAGLRKRGDQVPPARSLELSPPEDFERQQLDSLTASFAGIINSNVALLCQLDEKRRPPVVVSSWGLRASPESAARAHRGGFVDLALRAKRTVLGPIYPLLDWGLVHATEPPLSRAVAAQVRAETGVRGVLIGGFSTEPADSAWTMWATESHATLFALYLNAPDMVEGLLTERRADPLTGCLTYDSIRRELAREVNRARRARGALSCCFIHVDGPGSVQGQPVRGSRSAVFRLVAKTLRDSVRSCDTVGSYADDQFVAILPETTDTDARQLGERLRTLVRTQRLAGTDRPPNATIGVATWTADESAEQLLARAAADLSAAKALTQASPDETANGEANGAGATKRSTPRPLALSTARDRD